MYILYWGFKEILCTLYIYVLAKILQNGANFIQKLTPGFKIHMSNLDNFRLVKIYIFSSKKLKFHGLLPQKYIPTDKSLDLSSIAFKYLCENNLCHF